MIKKEERKKKSEIMLDILQKKSRTKKEWKKECFNQGVGEKTFYYHFKNFQKQGKIKYITEEKEWMIVLLTNQADQGEIKLYIDQIKNKNAKIRKLGTDELINLCKSKVVENNPFLIRFFEITFNNNSFKDVHGKILEAFRYILIRNLKEDNSEVIVELMMKNKDAIIRFINSGSLKLKSDAINTLRFCPGKDVLDILYERIKISDKQEYDYLKEAIRDCLKSHLKDYKVELKRKLFEIATATNSTEEVKERAIDLLYELSGLREKIIA